MQHATKHDERVHSETYKHCTLNARMIDMGASFVSLIFIACMWSCSSYTKRAIDDQLHSLPGADTPLLSNHFSGFLPVTKEKFIHYMYVESERDPVKDSIIFWTNGGPGMIALQMQNFCFLYVSFLSCLSCDRLLGITRFIH